MIISEIKSKNIEIYHNYYKKHLQIAHKWTKLYIHGGLCEAVQVL